MRLMEEEPETKKEINRVMINANSDPDLVEIESKS